MNAKIEIPVGELSRMERGVANLFKAAKGRVQRKMAEVFWLRVQGNLGDSGVDRAHTWAPLSPAYAKKVGREHATLLVSGALAASVKVVEHKDSSEVKTDGSVPYALAHQYGYEPNNLPARPFFPIDEDDSVLPRTEAAVMAAAKRELQNILS